MKVVRKPPIQFTCEHCGAVCQGDPDEFHLLNTMPPLWSCTCAYCEMTCKISAGPLVARHVSQGDSLRMLAEHPMMGLLGRR